MALSGDSHAGGVIILSSLFRNPGTYWLKEQVLCDCVNSYKFVSIGLRLPAKETTENSRTTAMV